MGGKSMAQIDVRDQVHQFIRDNFIFDDTKTVGGQTSLLGSGIVDSTGILELIGFLESRYSLKFNDNELIGENFDSIDKITAFLETKMDGHH
jgi:acyl carrier protein